MSLGKRNASPDDVMDSELCGGVGLKIWGDKEERKLKSNCGFSIFGQGGKDNFKSIIQLRAGNANLELRRKKQRRSLKNYCFLTPAAFPGNLTSALQAGGKQRLKKETDHSRLGGGRLSKQRDLLKMLVLFEPPDGSVSAPPTRILQVAKEKP